MNVVRVAVAVVALGGAACGDRPTLTLRYAPQAGAAFGYALEQELSMRVEGDTSGPESQQGLGIRIWFQQTVQGKAEGGTEVHVRVDTVALSSSEIPREMMQRAGAMLQGLTAALVFDERMQVVSSRVTDPGGATERDAAMVSSSLRGASMPLPAGPVRVGESWTIEMPAPTGQIPGLSEPLMLTTRLRLQSFRVEGVDTIAKISFETAFPKKPLPISLQGQGTIQIDGLLSGEQEYSLARQALVNTNMSGQVKTTTKGAGMGDNIVHVNQRMTLRLTEAKATP